jgi:hypothetical protein
MKIGAGGVIPGVFSVVVDVKEEGCKRERNLDVRKPRAVIQSSTKAQSRSNDQRKPQTGDRVQIPNKSPQWWQKLGSKSKSFAHTSSFSIA